MCIYMYIYVYLYIYIYVYKLLYVLGITIQCIVIHRMYSKHLLYILCITTEYALHSMYTVVTCIGCIEIV